MCVLQGTRPGSCLRTRLLSSFTTFYQLFTVVFSISEKIPSCCDVSNATRVDLLCVGSLRKADVELRISQKLLVW